MERKLTGRRRRKKQTDYGRAVRLSDLLLNFVERRREGMRSYDAWFRKQFGLPDWKGNLQPLIEGYLETTTGQFFLRTNSWDEAEQAAYEVSILAAAKAKVKKINRPIRMREIA